MSHRHALHPLSIATLLGLVAGCGEAPPIPVPPPAPIEGAKILAVAVYPPAEPLPYRCDTSRALEIAGRSYCVHDTSTTWDQAEHWCLAIGAHLASMDSTAENEALRVALASPAGNTGAFWIGLADPGVGSWKWVGDDRLGFAAWNVGEPNNSGGNEKCVEWITGNGLWNDLGCGQSRDYLCQKAAPPPPGRGTKNAARPFTCNGKSLVVRSKEYCFHQGAPLHWIAAAKACEAEGGELATLRTAAENDALKIALASPLGTNRVWIGFTDRGHEGRWEWISREPAAFTAWRPGEPNNAGGEDCAEWYVDGGGWNDLRCSEMLWSLCEAP